MGVLIASAPDEGATPAIEAAVQAGLTAGDSVELFLMGDGVHHALRPTTLAWLAAGVEVTVCAMDAEAQGLEPARLTAAGIHLGSQRDHAQLVLRSQRFLSFT